MQKQFFYDAAYLQWDLVVYCLLNEHLSYELCREKNRLFAYAKNKDADQLRGNSEADQCLCFRYTDSTIPLLPKSEISNL